MIYFIIVLNLNVFIISLCLIFINNKIHKLKLLIQDFKKEIKIQNCSIQTNTKLGKLSTFSKDPSISSLQIAKIRNKIND